MVNIEESGREAHNRPEINETLQEALEIAKQIDDRHADELRRQLRQAIQESGSDIAKGLEINDAMIQLLDVADEESPMPKVKQIADLLNKATKKLT